MCTLSFACSLPSTILVVHVGFLLIVCLCLFATFSFRASYTGVRADLRIYLSIRYTLDSVCLPQEEAFSSWPRLLVAVSTASIHDTIQTSSAVISKTSAVG